MNLCRGFLWTLLSWSPLLSAERMKSGPHQSHCHGSSHRKPWLELHQYCTFQKSVRKTFLQLVANVMLWTKTTGNVSQTPNSFHNIKLVLFIIKKKKNRILGLLLAFDLKKNHLIISGKHCLANPDVARRFIFNSTGYLGTTWLSAIQV